MLYSKDQVAYMKVTINILKGNGKLEILSTHMVKGGFIKGVTSLQNVVYTVHVIVIKIMLPSPLH